MMPPWPAWTSTRTTTYLPLVVLEAAGVLLDPSFAEQQKILQRCGGQFYLKGGAAACGPIENLRYTIETWRAGGNDLLKVLNARHSSPQRRRLTVR